MHLKHLALFVLLPFTITGQHAFSQNQLILLQPSGDQGGTFAYNLAPDGSYVAGDLNLSPNGARAHRWSTSGAAMNLGLLHGNGSSIAYSVSNGGGVVVGDSFTSATGVNEAFRWTPSDGMQGLGFLPGFTQSFANDVSADGTTIVGASSISGSGQAFRYTVNEGMQPLITMPGNYVFATGQAVSADGSVIAGHTETSFGSYRTFRWTAQTGMVDLGFGGDVGDISSDGSIIVGGTGAGPFKWTQAGGLMMLPLNDGIATGVTANGMTIVGNGQFRQSGPELQFIWDPKK